MADILKFDEVNRISEDYETYFGNMNLSNTEKNDRINLAKKFEIMMLYFFFIYSSEDFYDDDELIEFIEQKYIDIASEFLKLNTISEYIQETAKKTAKNIIDVTNRHNEEQWYTSTDRAMAIAENQANTIGNYRQQIDAIRNGKSFKIWDTMGDKRVRHTHSEANNQMVGIFETFKVGGYELSFPRDGSLGASADEIDNCRCTCRYL